MDCACAGNARTIENQLMSEQTSELAPVPYVPVQRVDAHTCAPGVQKAVADATKQFHRDTQEMMQHFMNKRGATEMTMEDLEKAKARLLSAARIDRRIIQGILTWCKKP
jgi:hypothetical protein